MDLLTPLRAQRTGELPDDAVLDLKVIAMLVRLSVRGGLESWNHLSRSFRQVGFRAVVQDVEQALKSSVGDLHLPPRRQASKRHGAALVSRVFTHLRPEPGRRLIRAGLICLLERHRNQVDPSKQFLHALETIRDEDASARRQAGKALDELMAVLGIDDPDGVIAHYLAWP